MTAAETEQDRIYRVLASVTGAPYRHTARERDMITVWRREKHLPSRNAALRDMIRTAFEREFPGWTLPEPPLARDGDT